MAGGQGQTPADLTIEVVQRPAGVIQHVEQFVDQHARTEPVMDDVVLQIEAGLRVADQLGPGPECFAAVGQQAKPRAAARSSSITKT